LQLEDRFYLKLELSLIIDLLLDKELIKSELEFTDLHQPTKLLILLLQVNEKPHIENLHDQEYLSNLIHIISIAS
jgi:hypothetical protein